MVIPEPAVTPSDVIVVVPTYNESENIEAIARAVRVHGYRLLVVDDDSPDGTGGIADRLATADAGIAVLHRSRKAGLGKAYAAGFEQALASGGEVLCEMDADFSHDPADLPRLVGAIEAGADLAIGSRYVQGGGAVDWPWYRRAISKGGNLYASLMLGIDVRDATAGYRAFRAEAIRRLEPETCEASGYAFQVEIAWRAERAGLTIVEVPIAFRDRAVGTSKMSPRIALEAMRLVTQWAWKQRFGRGRNGGDGST